MLKAGDSRVVAIKHNALHHIKISYKKRESSATYCNVYIVTIRLTATLISNNVRSHAVFEADVTRSRADSSSMYDRRCKYLITFLKRV